MKEIYKRGAIFSYIAIAVVALDQFTKYIIKSTMSLGESFPLTGFLQITHVHNTGAAFSIFREHTFLLAIFSMIGVVILLFLTFYLSTHIEFLKTMPAKISLGLIMGGTVGNLIDRLCYGYVVDFIDLSFFATFNVADSAISVGAVFLAISYIRLAKD